jgi:hypothetical protein
MQNMAENDVAIKKFKKEQKKIAKVNQIHVEGLASAVVENNKGCTPIKCV